MSWEGMGSAGKLAELDEPELEEPRVRVTVPLELTRTLAWWRPSGRRTCMA
jgi:hypothetical protein